MSGVLPRLSPARLPALPADVARPRYEPGTQRAGIVHLGIGAFHRAHQAAYTDAAMNVGDRDWAITGVSLRGTEVAQQLNPQQGLYTLIERDATGDALRVIGAVQQVLHAPSGHEAVVAALAATTTHVVTFTVTEKGYCRTAAGSLELASAHGGSIYGLLGAALEIRRSAGRSGLTLLSCDNLAANGTQLHALMSEYLECHSASLRRWFELECRCPSSMVDRIVPATTASDRDMLAARLGARDEGAVVAEPFTQWVIEDRFAGPRPGWQAVGAEFTQDVQAHETAKLRMLNGAHSALAYLGLERGHEFVHEAIADPALAPLIERLMRDEAATSLAPARAHDLAHYADALLSRFRNPALRHRLAQIAIDGSQKIPQRWLETLQHHQRQGRVCTAILAALAAWLLHVRGDRRPVDDPLAARLAQAWREAGTAQVVATVFSPDGPLTTDWVPTTNDRAELDAALATLDTPR